eukprot:13206392-Heterocapsa_arctica.AAC.1
MDGTMVEAVTATGSPLAIYGVRTVQYTTWLSVLIDLDFVCVGCHETYRGGRGSATSTDCAALRCTRSSRARRPEYTNHYHGTALLLARLRGAECGRHGARNRHVGVQY